MHARVYMHAFRLRCAIPIFVQTMNEYYLSRSDVCTQMYVHVSCLEIAVCNSNIVQVMNSIEHVCCDRSCVLLWEVIDRNDTVHDCASSDPVCVCKCTCMYVSASLPGKWLMPIMRFPWLCVQWCAHVLSWDCACVLSTEVGNFHHMR
jgi:hypothetical protein